MQANQFGDPKIFKSLTGLTALLSQESPKVKAYISASLSGYNRELKTIMGSSLTLGHKRRLALLIRNELRTRFNNSASYFQCSPDLQTHIQTFITSKVTRILNGEA